MKKSLCCTTLICAAVMLLPTSAWAQDDDGETITVHSRTTVKASKGRLLGRVSAPLPSNVEGADAGDCASDRVVRVSLKTTRGLKPAGRDITSRDGAWAIRGAKESKTYRVRVEPSEFVYSPRYGEFRRVRCLPVTLSGRVGRHGFRPVDPSVLGKRVARGGLPPAGRTDAFLPRSGAQLATTGAPIDFFALIAVTLIVLGGVFLLWRRPRRVREGEVR